MSTPNSVAAAGGAQPHSGKLSSASAAPQAKKTRHAADQPTNGSATSA